jgi:CheY-like chemotaxis protein
VFEPFFTTKPQGKGTGLGLAMVYGIVKQSQGYIWVDSTPGIGSRFTIHLPPPGPLSAEVQDLREPPSCSRRRGSEAVLVVDDDEAVRSLVERVLRQDGYDVLTAGGPDEAERILAGHDSVVDLLVTDVVMPDRDGRALASTLTERDRHLKVIYMTGYADQAPEADASGTAPFVLAKPFHPDALAATVRSVLDRTAGCERDREVPALVTLTRA